MNVDRDQNNENVCYSDFSLSLQYYWLSGLSKNYV